MMSQPKGQQGASTSSTAPQAGPQNPSTPKPATPPVAGSGASVVKLGIDVDGDGINDAQVDIKIDPDATKK